MGMGEGGGSSSEDAAVFTLSSDDSSARDTDDARQMIRIRERGAPAATVDVAGSSPLADSASSLLSAAEEADSVADEGRGGITERDFS